MTVQYSTTLRNDLLQQYEDTIGTSPKLQFRTGAPPANCAAADSGTLLVEMTLPSDWQGAPSSGSAAKAGTWSGTAAATGDPGHYRIKSSGGTCHEQGTVTYAVQRTTTDATAAGSNILNVDTTGLTTGMGISGPGVAGGATVFAVIDGASLQMSLISVLGVADATTITIGDGTGDWLIDVETINTSDVVTVDTRTLVAPGN